MSADTVSPEYDEGILHNNATEASEGISFASPRTRRRAFRPLLDLYASILFSKRFLFSFDLLLNFAVTIMSTILCYFYLPLHFSLSMSWRLLSITLVMPMITSTMIIFDRREFALQQIRIFRGRAYQLYQAHASWAPLPAHLRNNKDVSPDTYWLDHSDEVLSLLLLLGRDMYRYLTLPTFSRARHRVTAIGRREAKMITQAGYPLYQTCLVQRTEVLKRAGLELPETIRIRDWERMLTTSMEQLRLIKTYRSPQALRSFGRVYTFILPPLYGPSYIKLVRHFHSSAGSRGEIWIGICFGLIVAYTATAIFEMNNDLEDPFITNFEEDTVGA
jgi:hypothetical protein